MKKIIIIILLINILLPISITAKEYSNINQNNIYILRAGGGSSSSGGSGGGSHPSRSGHHGRNKHPDNPIVYLLNYILFILIAFSTSIFLYLKVIRSSINSKKYLKILNKNDITWKYKTIEKQAIKTFYIVQESWTNMNISNAKEYMTTELYNSFNIKLNFMEINHKRNILKMIHLLNIKPISIYDDEDNSKDQIWFYIKGLMIDYTINTETQEKLEGSNFPTTFIEFWKFKRNKNDIWVLDKIKQKDEIDTIIFQ